MAKLLVGHHQYDEVDLGSFHETEIQAQILARAPNIYPGFYFSLFDPLVSSDDGDHKPDFILVDRDYRSWWVGEVEMIHHSLYEHVIPQVRTFRDGQYTEAHVNHLVKRLPSIDAERARLMILGVRPQVLVIANRYREHWATTLKSEDVQLGIFEIFRRIDLAEYIFRINGFRPELPPSPLCRLYADPSIPRLLRAHPPSGIPINDTRQLAIRIGEAFSDWKVIIKEDKCWLHPLGGHNLNPGKRYLLVRLESGDLSITSGE